MAPDDDEYNAVRAQEAPQARLLRLAGLYDKLTDAARHEAFAAGRAKDAWTQTAIAAQAGTDAPDPLPGYAPAADGRAGPPTHAPDPARPQYARELLAQCQPQPEPAPQHRADDEREHGIASSLASTAAGLAAYLYPSASSSSLSSSSPAAAPAAPIPPLGPENGYPGSRVWGLLPPAPAPLLPDTSSGGDRSIRSGSSSSGGTAEPARVDRSRQRQVEWHAFLRYAALKERELYAVFRRLDQDRDGRLTLEEVEDALRAHGIELSDTQLRDFVASLSSSRNWHAHLTGDAIPPKPASPSAPAPAPAAARGPGASPGRAEAPGPGSTYVTWPEFRDYLLLLPRVPSVPEIVRFYQARKTYGLFRRESGIFRDLASGSWAHSYYDITTHERGGAGVTADGDSDVTGNMDDATRKQTPTSAPSDADAGAASGAGTSTGPGAGSSTLARPQSDARADHAADEDDLEPEEEEGSILPGGVAIKYLLAGGIAGGISRTATAPFDRLKVYLITQSSADPVGVGAGGSGGHAGHAGRMAEAARTLYVKGGGLRSFWVGNGLNVVKIFPESAIKFFSYESIKRVFAQHVDHVSDPRDISPRSRFLSGGLAGITAQLSIYPVETVKTVMMSSSYDGRGDGRSTSMAVVATVRSIYAKGGLRGFYRGLPAGLVGVFPYSAIDMSTFEGAKLAYLQAAGRSDMPVYATLMIGSISGSFGAVTVYPLNLVRTRLQASGTPAHPFIYHGFLDAFRQTYAREGLRGFYSGLGPTLAKVIPAVSISYTVYEQSKKLFGVI